MEKKYVIFKADDYINQKELDKIMRDFAAEWRYDRYLCVTLSDCVTLTKEGVIKAAEKQGVADWVVFELPKDVVPIEEMRFPDTSYENSDFYQRQI